MKKRDGPPNGEEDREVEHRRTMKRLIRQPYGMEKLHRTVVGNIVQHKLQIF